MLQHVVVFLQVPARLGGLSAGKLFSWEAEHDL